MDEPPSSSKAGGEISERLASPRENDKRIADVELGVLIILYDLHNLLLKMCFLNGQQLKFPINPDTFFTCSRAIKFIDSKVQGISKECFPGCVKMG